MDLGVGMLWLVWGVSGNRVNLLHGVVGLVRVDGVVGLVKVDGMVWLDKVDGMVGLVKVESVECGEWGGWTG